MAKEIELPDGSIAEFPDDMHDDAIGEVLRKQFAAAPAGLTPEARKFAVTDKPGYIEQFAGGAKHALDRAAAGLQSVAGSVGIPTGESLQPLVQQGGQFVKETGPTSTVGQIAGDVAMSAPVALRVFKGLNAARGVSALNAPAADMLTNAGYSALTADEGNRLGSGAVGALTGAAPHVLGKALKLTGAGTANVLGMTTGSGGESVKQAFRGAPGFVENMRGQVPASDVVELARSGVHNMRQVMQNEYKANQAVWSAGQQALDITPIRQAYDEVAKSLQHEGVWKIGQAEQGILQQANEVINAWGKDPKMHTAAGLDALKQRLSAIYPESPQHTQAQRAISSMATAARDAIIKQNPTYATAMKSYWQQASQLDEIERALSLGDKASIDTALRKLQSLTRNNANANYGQRASLAETLSREGGADVMPAVAGQSMSSWLPRGIQQAVTGGAGTMGVASGVLNLPAAAAAGAVQSPRLVGELARYAGKAYQHPATEATIKALRSMTPAAARIVDRNQRNQKPADPTYDWSKVVREE